MGENAKLLRISILGLIGLDNCYSVQGTDFRQSWMGAQGQQSKAVVQAAGQRQTDLRRQLA